MIKKTKEWTKNNKEMVKRKNDKYNDSVDRITIVAPKGTKERIAAAAQKENESVSAFCVRVLEKSLKESETNAIE